MAEEEEAGGGGGGEEEEEEEEENREDVKPTQCERRPSQSVGRTAQRLPAERPHSCLVHLPP